MKTNHEIIAVFDLKYEQEQFDYSFPCGDAVVKLNNDDNPSKLELVLSGSQNMGIGELENTFFLI